MNNKRPNSRTHPPYSKTLKVRSSVDVSLDSSGNCLKGLRQRRVRRESTPEERESQEEVNAIPTVPSSVAAAAAPISRVMSNALKAWTTIMLGLVHDLTNHHQGKLSSRLSNIQAPYFSYHLLRLPSAPYWRQHRSFNLDSASATSCR